MPLYRFGTAALVAAALFVVACALKPRAQRTAARALPVRPVAMEIDHKWSLDPATTFDLGQAPIRKRMAMFPADTLRRRLAHALDIDFEDKLFASLHDSRLSLGEVDYGIGMLPDRNWNAAKMVRVVEALQPICAEKHHHFATPETLDQLQQRIYHEPLAESARAELLAAQPQNACIAYFTAASFTLK